MLFILGVWKGFGIFPKSPVSGMCQKVFPIKWAVMYSDVFLTVTVQLLQVNYRQGSWCATPRCNKCYYWGYWARSATDSVYHRRSSTTLYGKGEETSTETV